LSLQLSLLKRTELEIVVVEGWNGGGVVEVSDWVLHCSFTLQLWGKRKRVHFQEEIQQCTRILESIRSSPNGMNTARFREENERHARLLVQEEAF